MNTFLLTATITRVFGWQTQCQALDITDTPVAKEPTTVNSSMGKTMDTAHLQLIRIRPSSFTMDIGSMESKMGKESMFIVMSRWSFIRGTGLKARKQAMENTSKTETSIRESGWPTGATAKETTKQRKVSDTAASGKMMHLKRQLWSIRRARASMNTEDKLIED